MRAESLCWNFVIEIVYQSLSNQVTEIRYLKNTALLIYDISKLSDL